MAEDDEDYYSGMSDTYEDEDDGEILDPSQLEEDEDFVSTSIPLSQVITEKSLLLAQTEDLRKVMELLGLKEHHARTLLIHHRWKVERILDLLERKGMEHLFLEAGITITENGGNSSSRPSAPITCNICFEDVSQSATTMMECGHCFCNDCWTEHFIAKINEGQSRRIRCMTYKCNAICDEDIVRHLVSERDPDLSARFDRFLLESYIDDNPKVKWCPSMPHCGKAIRVKDDRYCEVECTCGLQFCFNCLLEVHSPCSCLMWDLWSKKCRDESDNLKWITEHTKPCPRCGKAVQKNGGCNLVRCICRQPFCWLCGEATGSDHTWETITGHNCNRYKDDKHMSTNLSKSSLDRYLHYLDRFKAHSDSLNLESNLKETMQKKISVYKSTLSVLEDYRWLQDGLHRLFRSRRVLTYTYPFAFYMFGDELFSNEMPSAEREIKKTLFEDQQEQLESNVEKLSMYLEKDFEKLSDAEIIELRRHVINLSRAVDNFCKQMYQSIEEDFYSSFQFSTHYIAPYKSMGLERASEISECPGYDPNPSGYLQQDLNVNGTDALLAREDTRTPTKKKTLRKSFASCFRI